MNCQARKYLFQEFKYFFRIGVSYTVTLFSLLLLKLQKKFFRNVFLTLFPKQKKEPSLIRTDVPISFTFFIFYKMIYAMNENWK